MGARIILSSFFVLLISSSCLKAAAENSGSVMFLEGSDGKYLRNHPLDALAEKSIDLSEISGAVSILLGISPSSSFSPDSSSKLNEILTPNPFNRPHAVFLLQVDGIDDIEFTKIKAGNILKEKVVGATKATINLPGEEYILVTKIDESSETESNDEQFSNLANFFEGSYSEEKLSLPLTTGYLNLNLSKESELNFALSLSNLIRGIKSAIKFHEEFSDVIQPAELITGHFKGFKALGEEYSNQANEIFETTLSKLFDLLHKSYKGEIVGVVVCNKEEADKIEVTSSPQTMSPSSRLLQETLKSDNSTIAQLEIKLVRTTLAWITGIILLVFTLIGVCMLMNMPLTRDTLLYSNVKLD